MFYSEAAIRGVLIKKGVFKNFAKLTGKHLCQSIFFNKVAALKPATLFYSEAATRGVLINKKRCF